MKHFYICAELGEGIPDYDFCVKANTKFEAETIALEILTSDYGSSDTPHKNFSCEKVTAEDLLNLMTIR